MIFLLLFPLALPRHRQIRFAWDPVTDQEAVAAPLWGAEISWQGSAENRISPRGKKQSRTQCGSVFLCAKCFHGKYPGQIGLLQHRHTAIDRDRTATDRTGYSESDYIEMLGYIPANQSDLDTKVDKIDGLGLSKNDFTDAFKEKLENLNVQYNTTEY